MTRRQLGELLRPVIEKEIRANEQGFDPLPFQRRERRIEIAFDDSFGDDQFLPECV